MTLDEQAQDAEKSAAQAALNEDRGLEEAHLEHAMDLYRRAGMHREVKRIAAYIQWHFRRDTV